MSKFKWTGQGPTDTGGQPVEALDDWQDQNGANGVPGPGDSATIDIAAEVHGVLDAASLELDANVGYNGSQFTLGGDLLINTANGLLTLSEDTNATVGGNLQVAQDAFDATSTQTYESTLQVNQGSTLTVDDDALVGDAAGASGYIDVMQGASLAVDGTLDIGGAGLGVVYVTGTLSVGSLALGGNATSYQSLLQLGGPTAPFTDATPLVVGYDATFGEFRLAYGASFSTPCDLVVGLDDTGLAFASGAVEVDESTLTVGGNLLLGEADDTGQVAIDYFDTDDAGASLTQVAGNVIVGDAADASGAINIGNQGTLSILAGHSLDLGAVLDSTGNLDLNAAGAVLSMTGTLVIGDAGTGEVGVENGARLSVTGEQALAVQSTARADVYVAALGEFTVLGELDVGQGGIATLEAASGGTITASSADIGELAGSDGTVIVTGADPTTSDPSTWTVANALTVGDAGAGSLAIEAGGKVTSQSGLIGTGAANDGTVTVDGSGSSWAITNSLTLGVQGGTGAPSLTISDDASVTTTTNPLSGDYLYSGSLTLESGGQLSETGLDMHDAATLTIESGATLAEVANSTAGAVYYGLGANGTVTIDAGTLASAGEYITVGETAQTGGAGTSTLTASDGATIVGLATDLGEFAGDSGTVTLTGTDTTWTDTFDTPVDSNDAGFNVGVRGNGSLLIEDGATLSNPFAYIKIGQFAGATGTATVTGAGSTMSAGGLLRVGDSGQGTLTVADSALAAVGAVQVGVYSTSSGLLTITSGGTLTTNSASTVDVGAEGGAAESVTAGNFTIGVLSGAKGTVSVDGGTLTVEGDLQVGDGRSGAMTVEDGGAVTAATLDVGTASGTGTVMLDAGGKVITTATNIGGNGAILMDDGLLDPTAAIQISADGSVSGFGVVEGDISDNGTLTAQGGALDIHGAVSGGGAIAIDADATLALFGDIASDETISFNGTDATLTLEDATDFVPSGISGFRAGDALDLMGFTPMDGDITNDGTNTFIDLDARMVELLGYVAPLTVDGDSVSAACYLRGTRILTPTGEVRVEDLNIGDAVVTRFSGIQLVKWIGHRALDCRRHPNPSDVWPVRIRAGAFGDGLPLRDRLLSPEHAVFVDGVLVPIRCLVNGVTIAPEQRDEVGYYHIELERHDVILAEGLPCESWLDCGNRAMFANCPVTDLHPPFARSGDHAWIHDACAPLVEGGPRLDAISTRLRALAGIEGGDPQASELRGWIDSVTHEIIRGWAWQPEHPHHFVQVDILAGDTVLGAALASKQRDDVRDAGHGDGRCGFTFRLLQALSPFVPHTIRVRRASHHAELWNSGKVMIAAAVRLDAPALAGFATALNTTAAMAKSDAERDGLMRLMTATTDRLRSVCAHASRSIGGAGAPRPLALFIDAVLPVPDRDSASQVALDHMRALQNLGYRVAFAAFDVTAAAGDTAPLEALGVTVCLPPAMESVEEMLRRLGAETALVYLHREGAASLYAALVRHHCPKALLIYGVADLHFVQTARQAMVEGKPWLATESRRLRDRELLTASMADRVITHSPVEAAILRQHAPRARVHVVPWSMTVRETTVPFAQRRGLAFIGGYRHAPNVDAAGLLVDEIMPLVWQAAPDIECLLVGSHMPDQLRRLTRPGIVPLGHVPDLATILHRVRLTVAPLRYGAGIKGKVLYSLAAGVPCVGTPIAAEGIALPPVLLGCLGKSAGDLAEQIIRLHAQEQDNAACAQAGLRLVRAGFSADLVDARMRAAIGARAEVIEIGSGRALRAGR